MKRVSIRLSTVAVAATLGLATLVSASGPAAALSNPTIPALTVSGSISSRPWPAGALSSVNANDIEGLAYVPSDNSIWVADDNRDRLYEIDATTGGLKSQLLAATFQTQATQVGTGYLCDNPALLETLTPADTGANECRSRTDDFESVVYDPSGDGTLYVTSGACCTGGLPSGYPAHPTVYQLTRVTGHFQPATWRALPETEDPTAGGWRPGAGLYFGKNDKIKTYDYATGAPPVTVKTLPVSSIVGVHFTDANTAFVTTATKNTASGRTTADSDSTIRRFNISGSTWTLAPGWTFPLAGTGMIDARDLTIVGDAFYVSDGYDSPSGVNHKIYVYTLGNAVAQFAAFPSTGNRPLAVQFFDTSTGTPTSWAWDFDNNNTVDSTQQHPSHIYTSAGDFTVKLTVTYAGGSLSTTQVLKVTVPTGAPGGWIADGWGGLHPVKIGTNPLPPKVSGGPYWTGWDIVRGVATLPDNTAGLVLDGWGGLHQFHIGANTNTVTIKGGPYWTGWDIARGVSILPNGKGGYVIDGAGGIHPFALGNNALPPAALGAPYWAGQDRVTGLIIAADGKGGYTVDFTGKLWPFRFAGGVKPPAANSVSIVTAVAMQGGALVADGTGGITVDGWGGTHPFGVGAFGPPPKTTAGPYWVGWNIARDIALLHS